MCPKYVRKAVVYVRKTYFLCLSKQETFALFQLPRLCPRNHTARYFGRPFTNGLSTSSNWRSSSVFRARRSTRSTRPISWTWPLSSGSGGLSATISAPTFRNWRQQPRRPWWPSRCLLTAPLLIASREDVNFWKPLGEQAFGAVPAGAPFLLMLRKPYQCIVGMGYFMSQIALPVPIAWGTFGVRSGAADYESFARAIRKYPAALNKPRLHDPGINCLVLNAPVFFRKPDWMPAPASLGNRVYDTKEAAGSQLWAAVSATIFRYRQDTFSCELVTDSLALVTQAYNKRCAISGEKTLPVLEAAHIQLFAQAGPSSVGNGLLRSNLHKLVDRHCITIDADDKTRPCSSAHASGRSFRMGRNTNAFTASGCECCLTCWLTSPPGSICSATTSAFWAGLRSRTT
jgi:putative restriction endonuclease